MKRIVAKFGGSSVRDAKAFNRCLDIITNNPQIKIVILSATYNTTNELEELFESKSSSLKESIIKRHKKLALELEVFELNEFWSEVEDRLENYQSRDELLSVGEYLSSYLFFRFIEKNSTDIVAFKDARHFIITDNYFGGARPIFSEIEKKCSDINSDQLTITQGFIGSTVSGETTVLGREGSDYSAALFAAATGADEVQIWTDVDGVYSADPRIVKNARPLKELSYNQASTLARGGAKVLFPETLAPAREKGCLVRVLSSLDPGKEGTLISCRTGEKSSITCMKENNYWLYTIVGPHTFIPHSINEIESFESFDGVTKVKVTCDTKKMVEILNELHDQYCL